MHPPMMRRFLGQELQPLHSKSPISKLGRGLEGSLGACNVGLTMPRLNRGLVACLDVFLLEITQPPDLFQAPELAVYMPRSAPQYSVRNSIGSIIPYYLQQFSKVLPRGVYNPIVSWLLK